jgi:chemotaxis protein CheX
MEEDILKVFARSTARYFDQIASGGAILGTPYLRSIDEKVALDFASIIGISGAYRGGVYYTAPREKLEKLLPLIGESTPDDQLCADLIGEIANSIAGNARGHLGAGFMISTPFVLTGHSGDVHTPRGVPCYVMPVTWAGHVSRVLVTLEKSEDQNQ